MPTTGLGIVTPDGSDGFDLTIDLAAMAISIDSAILAHAGRIIGTDAQRIALSGPALKNGLEWYSTDTNLGWLRASGTWRVTGGLLPYADANVPAGTVPADTWTTLALALSAGRHVTVAAGKLTVSVAGRYQITAGATIQASTAGQARIRKNGTDLFRESISSIKSGAAYPVAMAEMNLVPGDYLEFQVVSNSGGTLFGGSVNITFVQGV